MRVRPSYHSGFARFAAESERSELWRGLVGAWTPNLGNTGQRLVDFSGRGNHGMGVGGPAWSANRLGPCMAFDGSTQYVGCGTLGDLGSSMGKGVTVDCWFVEAANAWTTQYLFSASVPSSDNMKFTIRLNASAANSIDVTLRDWSASVKALSGGTSGGTKTQLHHILVTASPSANTLQVWLDGVSKGITYTKQETPDTFQNFSGTNPVAIAAYRAYNTFYTPFKGQINHLAVWNRVLGSSEVRQLHADPLGMFRPRRRVVGVRQQTILRRNLYRRSGARGVTV